MKADEAGLTIKIGQDIIDPRPRTALDALETWLAARKIKILPETQADDLANLIQIMPQMDIGWDLDVEVGQAEDDLGIVIGTPQEEIRIDGGNEEIRTEGPEQEERLREELEIGVEPFMRVAVSAQKNIEGAQIWFGSARGTTKEILGNSAWQEVYNRTDWYAQGDVAGLAQEWQIPICLYREGGVHWQLALRPPERFGGGYRVLVYDPKKDGEAWVNLPDYKGTYEAGDMWSNGLFTNQSGLEQLRAGEYNFSLYGDQELADNREVWEAKQTHVQLPGDGWNCGPSCLFMAALREGVKEGWNGFKFSGRETLEQQTGLKVWTREEILARLRK